MTRKNHLRVAAFVTLLCFSLSSGASAEWAPPVAGSLHSHVSFRALFPRLTIPETLGTIQVVHQPQGSRSLPAGRQGKGQVILIQDAHAILDAQKNIQKLIEYLQEKYGISLVALEGGKGRLDPTLFQAFPNEVIKKKVLHQYLERGELSGAEMAAIFEGRRPKVEGGREEGSPSHVPSALPARPAGGGLPPSAFYGIEDWNLYEADYLAYLRAMQVKEKLLEKLQSLKSQFDLEREQTYSPKLNEFHNHKEAFYEESSHVMELLRYLASLGIPFARHPEGPKGPEGSQILRRPFGAPQDDALQNYPHLSLLFQSLAQDSSLEKETLEVQIRKLGKSFQKRFLTKLPLEKQKEFNQAYQSFLTGSLDPGSFLKSLIETAHTLGVKPKLSPSIQSLLTHTETLSTIKGTQLF